jgi:hypothetical protein
MSVMFYILFPIKGSKMILIFFKFSNIIIIFKHCCFIFKIIYIDLKQLIIKKLNK